MPQDMPAASYSSLAQQLWGSGGGWPDGQEFALTLILFCGAHMTGIKTAGGSSTGVSHEADVSVPILMTDTLERLQTSPRTQT